MCYSILTYSFLLLCSWAINNTYVLVLFKNIYQLVRKTITRADIKDQEKNYPVHSFHCTDSLEIDDTGWNITVKSHFESDFNIHF